jgi:hypothetical protein
MKQTIKLGVTDRTVLVFIPDPASTDGSGKTGLNAAALTVSYVRVETDNDVVVTDVTSSLNDLSALTDAHNDWGLKEVSNTLAPGLYRLDIADAVFASGAWSAVVYVMITSSAAAASPMEFILVAYDQLDAVRLGLTALPNAAADAAGGLPISDAGGLDLDAQIVTKINDILEDTGTTLDDLVDNLEARLGTPSDLGSGATVAANLADIEAQTDDIGVAGAGLTAVPDLAGVTTLLSRLSATRAGYLDNLSAGAVATAANLAIVAGYIDTEIQTLITMLTGIVPVNGTIGATGNDTTHLHLAGLAYGDDGPNAMLLLVKDVSAGIFVSRWIEDFANTGDLATVSTLPFTPEASVDQYWLLPVRADVTGGSGLDAAGVRAALGMASANLDTQLSDIDNLVDDLEARVGTPSNLGGGATLSANLADIEAQTDDIGVAGAGLTAIPDLAGVTTLLARLTAARAGYLDNINNATLAAAVFPTDPADQSLVIAATNALASAISALNNLSQADVRTALGLASANLDMQLGDLPTNAELATALASADDPTLAAIAALNNISPAGVRAALGLASANLDTQLDALPTNAELATALAAADDVVLAAIAALSIPTANANADALLDRTNGIETSYTLRQAMRLILSATAGKLSGAATNTIAIRNVGDSKDRITATVDADGNRTAVTLDAT